ncbi:MAG: DUF533 domain-containing protein [Granulosicoccus sp.]
MSLVGTLGKLAVGVMVAKGVGKMMGGAGGGAGGGLGGLLGSVLGGASSSGPGSAHPLPGGAGGLGDLGSLLGGKAAAGGAASGGLGGLLESIAGGGAAADNSAPIGGSLGDLLNGALQGNKVPEPQPTQESQAKLLIQAMINAAKSDGNIDQAEQQKLVANLGDDVSQEERQFVLSEMQSPLDADGFIKSIPKGSEQQVYMMSLMGIDLDSKAEAQYLDKLRQGIGMSEQASNAIHQKLGVPTLYS